CPRRAARPGRAGPRGAAHRIARRRRRRRRGGPVPQMTAIRTSVCALALALALGRLAAAQPAAPDDRAQAAEAAALYDEGKRHFDIGEYAQAIASWKQSYLRSSAPLLLFNIAQAYRLSGNCAQANRFYLKYQNLVPKPANAAELAAAMDKCKGI